MTPSLAPGFPLTDNLLLTEELPAPPDAIYRVWFALNLQLGQIVAVKIYTDGRVESIDTNPVATTPPTVQTPPASPPLPPPGWETPPPNQHVYVPPVPPVFDVPPPPAPSWQRDPFVSAPVPLPRPRPMDTGRRRWLRYGLIGLLLLSLAAAGYAYRKSLRPYTRSVARSFRSLMKTRPDSAVKQPADSVDLGDKLSNGAEPELATLPPVDPNEPELSRAAESPSTVNGPSANAITAQQATRLLNLMPRIPPEKHPAIFADARQAFTNLRQTGGRQSYIDSLYTVCMGRGAQSFITYQQNGDPVSKRYAVDWYQTAYALKPGQGLQERLTRLKNGAPKNRPKPVRKPPKSNGSLFMSDPEVNR